MHRSRSEDVPAPAGGRLIIRMNSDSGWVRGVAALTEQVGLALGLDAARAEGAAAATCEACLNAIEHGSAGCGAAPDVVVRFEPAEESLTVAVEDGGPLFEPPASPPRLEQQLDGSAPIRGWGFALMRGLSDRVEVAPGHAATGGKAVRLVFLRPRRAAESKGRSRS